jgi:hypothetical protein
VKTPRLTPNMRRMLRIASGRNGMVDRWGVDHRTVNALMARGALALTWEPRGEFKTTYPVYRITDEGRFILEASLKPLPPREEPEL